jgi:hypothetical protein
MQSHCSLNAISLFSQCNQSHCGRLAAKQESSQVRELQAALLTQAANGNLSEVLRGTQQRIQAMQAAMTPFRGQLAQEDLFKGLYRNITATQSIATTTSQVGAMKRHQGTFQVLVSRTMYCL